MIDKLIKKYELNRDDYFQKFNDSNHSATFRSSMYAGYTVCKGIIKDLEELQEQQDNEIIPFDWSEEVLSGKHKVVVSLPSETVRGDIDVNNKNIEQMD